MRAIARISMLAGCAWIIGSASTAGSPSMTLDMPSEIKSWRDEVLSRDEYTALAGEWRAYSDSHPESAVARVQLARALRYARTSTPE
ncbi:MAG: hypothetical protein R3E97_20250 [Candidatus Eisenbacteria bacterium]